MHFNLSIAAAALLATASALPGGDFGHAWKPQLKKAWGTGSVSVSQPTGPTGSSSTESQKPGPTGDKPSVKPTGTGSVPSTITDTTKIYTTTTVSLQNAWFN